MLEFGSAETDAGAAEVIKDATDATFMADVVETSMQTPVIVDFWAPWCGPCKTLTPALEGAVKKARGAVHLVKVNVDENQAIAAQLRVQSIPTVYAFSGGQPVDGFQGALSPAEVDRFVEKIAKLGNGGGGGLEEALEAAEAMLEEGAAVDAAETFAAILGEDPANARAYAGMVRAHLSLDELDRALALIENAPPEVAGAAEVEAIKAQVDLSRQAAEAGPVAELHARVRADADDHQARLDLATALHASGETEAAITELLELFRRDREWNDAAAKNQLFTIFDALGPKDPLAQTGRRKLSSMIFA
ncbi:MAG: thioredoxin [Pseudomonadota bacterium]